MNEFISLPLCVRLRFGLLSDDDGGLSRCRFISDCQFDTFNTHTHERKWEGNKEWRKILIILLLKHCKWKWCECLLHTQLAKSQYTSIEFLADCPLSHWASLFHYFYCSLFFPRATFFSLSLSSCCVFCLLRMLSLSMPLFCAFQIVHIINSICMQNYECYLIPTSLLSRSLFSPFPSSKRCCGCCFFCACIGREEREPETE